uniref:Uncharacterized protein n=1 Tax=Timema bartmani TaxID=61472 RepID=A0A7R9F2H5_9NEOP|nr:unnamed protein product [Timema bartmani]
MSGFITLTYYTYLEPGPRSSLDDRQQFCPGMLCILALRSLEDRQQFCPGYVVHLSTALIPMSYTVSAHFFYERRMTLRHVPGRRREPGFEGLDYCEQVLRETRTQVTNSLPWFTEEIEKKNYFCRLVCETSRKRPEGRDQWEETSGKRPVGRDQWEETSGKRPVGRDQWEETRGKRPVGRDHFTPTVLMKSWCPNGLRHRATVATRSWGSTEPQYSSVDSLNLPARVIASRNPTNTPIGDMMTDRRVARGSPFAKISHPAERISQAERHRRCRREQLRLRDTGNNSGDIIIPSQDERHRKQLRIEQESRVRLRKMQSSLSYPKDAVKIKDIDTRPKKREDLEEIANRALDKEGYQSVYFRVSGSRRESTGRKDRQTDTARIVYLYFALGIDLYSLPSIPDKLIEDADTEIQTGDLFDFDVEVEPYLEVLVGASVYQAMDEVVWEKQVGASQRRANIFNKVKAGEKAEVQRLNERNRRLQEEDNRRKKEHEEGTSKQEDQDVNIASANLVRGALVHVLPQVLTGLKKEGYRIEDLRTDVDEHFLPWLVEEVRSIIDTKENVSKKLVGIVTRLVEERILQENVGSDTEVDGSHLKSSLLVSTRSRITKSLDRSRMSSKMRGHTDSFFIKKPSRFGESVNAPSEVNVETPQDLLTSQDKPAGSKTSHDIRLNQSSVDKELSEPIKRTEPPLQDKTKSEQEIP